MRLVWRRLEAELHGHFDREETYAFPLIVSERLRDAQALRAEHGHLRARVAELAREIERGAIRPGMIRGFVDELQAHARHEEKLLYAAEAEPP